ncbi:MAG: NrfD/PsrC family molybdoenzyme membrane anchor subunit, partial [Egibacteraceae bacterium]
VMERRLGELAEPYSEGDAGRFASAARALTAAGAAVLGLSGVAGAETGQARRRIGAVAGAGMLLGGAVCQRWAVYRAGFASAEDPRYAVAQQRARMAARAAASRPA